MTEAVAESAGQTLRILSDIALGKFVDTGSVVHRLDPRTKLLSALLLMTSALTLDAAPPLILFTVFLGFAVRLAEIPATTLLTNLKPFLWLFAFTVILHALMTPGRVLVHLPGLQWSVSQEGLRFGLLFCWRLATIVTVAALMTLTTPPLALTDGLERMLRPLRRLGFPAHEFAMMIAIALRFIPVLAEEAERIRKAQLARGADFSGGLLRRARQMMPLLVPLFLSAFDRADRLAVAMESRCYQGGEGRTSFRELSFSRADLTAAAIVVSAAALMVAHSLAPFPAP